MHCVQIPRLHCFLCLVELQLLIRRADRKIHYLHPVGMSRHVCQEEGKVIVVGLDSLKQPIFESLNDVQETPIQNT